MASKFSPLVILLVAIMAASVAQAQLLGGLGGLLGGVLGLIRINGSVFCSLDGNIGVINGTVTPVFSNALVQLQCGGNVVSSATTNASGVFSIVLDPLHQHLVSSLLSGCNVVVKTPLSTCNANLPSVGGLLSNLQFIGNTLQGVLNITNLIPSGFQFLPKLN